jgi:hypothetical protein
MAGGLEIRRQDATTGKQRRGRASLANRCQLGSSSVANPVKFFLGDG